MKHLKKEGKKEREGGINADVGQVNKWFDLVYAHRYADFGNNINL